MKIYKYTDATNTVVHVIDEDGVSRMSMLASELPADTVIEPADPVPNPRIAQIHAELEALDRKSIRALREGDATRIADIESQAEALRVELRGL